MTEPLKGCPFCGNSAIVHERVDETCEPIYYVRCNPFKPGWCGAMVAEKPEGGGLFHVRDEAIAAWNRRPSAEALVEALRELTEAILRDNQAWLCMQETPEMDAAFAALAAHRSKT